MIDDPDRCYAALQARDARFDGWFVVAVTSTGIYCRPSCPARTPHRRNARFLPTAAAAQAAGFRACRRCRPDASPGSPAWDVRGDLVARAMRAIADGVVDREGVRGLAARLGYSERHLHRELTAAVGAGPRALARAQRAQTARILIETTDLPFAAVAFAAGFGSVRQFNDTVREVFVASPSQLRRRRRGTGASTAGALRLRLPFRQPAALDRTVAHLARRAVPGLERVEGDRYLRGLRLPHGDGEITLRLRPDHVDAVLRLQDLRDLRTAVSRCRQLLDLDADPVAVDGHLAADPFLRGAVRRHPGVRVLRTVEPFEAAVRTVVGQQISVAGARTLTARIVARYGRSPQIEAPEVSRCFPCPAELALADLTTVGLTRSRAATVQALADVVATGRLDLSAGTDRAEVRSRLGTIDGIGSWTTEMIAMRALGDPDAWPGRDLVLRRAALAQGLPGDPSGLDAHAERWRPWRAYAAHHLWEAATDPRYAAA